MRTNPKLSDIIQALIPEARAETLRVPGTNIDLFLINPDYPRHALPHDVALQLMERPLYWAFCWAAGAVLARYVIQHPDLVKNKTVLDFGSGSGAVAIAAAQVGAKQVLACDNDPNALLAIGENAKLNRVKVTLLSDIGRLAIQPDVLLAADVLYDRENLPLLNQFLALADISLVADSRIKNFSHTNFQCIDSSDACTLPDLDESKEFRQVRIYQSRPIQ